MQRTNKCIFPCIVYKLFKFCAKTTTLLFPCLNVVGTDAKLSSICETSAKKGETPKKKFGHAVSKWHGTLGGMIP